VSNIIIEIYKYNLNIDSSYENDQGKANGT